MKLYVLFVLLFFNTSSFASQINQIRFGRQSDTTLRIVVHMDKKSDFQIFTLENPYRLVVDWEDTNMEKDLLSKMPVQILFIKDIRIGNPFPNKTRLVLETKSAITFKDGFFLSPSEREKSWRFVVDVSSSKTSKPPQQTVLFPIKKTPPPEQNYTQKMTKPLIVIDPGHGGEDPGAISYTGRYEKNLTLQMAKEIKKSIESTGKYRVVLSRKTDKALALRNRIAFAHENKAALFISIHADSAKNKKARGLSVYTISEKASDKEAQMLAESENKADIILGINLNNEAPEVSNILIDLAKRDTMEKSSHFANILVDKMGKRVTLVKGAHRFAGFVVLKSPNIPSVLLEIGYLSNKEEEKLLATSVYRAKLTKSIVEAIDSYFNTLYE